MNVWTKLHDNPVGLGDVYQSGMMTMSTVKHCDGDGGGRLMGYATLLKIYINLF